VNGARDQGRAIGLTIACLLAAGIACSTVTGAFRSTEVQSGSPRPQAVGPASTAAAANTTPTPKVIGPLPAGFEQTGKVEAIIDGEPYTWYTFRPPAAAGSTTNSAGWSLRGGPLGTYKGVVALAAAFEGDTPDPISGIYLEFPFQDEGAPFQLDVPANPLEPAVEVRVNLGTIDYQMVEGVLTLKQVEADETKRTFSGTFEGTLAPSDSQGDPGESTSVALVSGQFSLEQVESADELPTEQGDGS